MDRSTIQPTPTSWSSENLLDLLDAVPGTTFVLDDEGRFAFVGGAAARTWGRSPDELLGRVVWEAFPELDGTPVRKTLEQALASGDPVVDEVDCPVLGRRVRLTAQRRSPGLVVHVAELDETPEADAHAERHTGHYRRALRATGLVVARIDRDLRYVWIDNPHPDFDAAAVIGKRDYDLADDAGTQALVALKREVLDTDQRVRQEITFPMSDGERIYAVLGEPLHDRRGVVIGMTTVAIDVSDVRRLERAADTDYLTGAANRRAVERVLRQEVKRMERYNSRFSVVMLDVDHFKAVNDAYGHRVGDHVLTEIVRRLRLDMRAVDRLARWGGEEFLLVLPEIERDDAIRAAERFREQVAGQTFEHAASLTISLGVVMSRPGEDADALVRRADAALYQAKRTGRDRVVVG